jgi:hypothetical protein
MDALDREHHVESPPGWDDSLHFATRVPEREKAGVGRIAIAAFVLALHGLFWWALVVLSAPHADAEGEASPPIIVQFIQTLPRMEILAPAPTRDRQSTPPLRAIDTPAPRLPRTHDEPLQAATDAPLQLYAPDGSLRLPEGLFEKIDSAANNRQFDFQLPNLEEAGRFLDRPPAITYESTRFDQYWAPNESVLDEILRKAVEKTSKEIRIPIPGAPGRRFVCRVSLLAAGGVCGMERNGGNAVVSLDDPTTLDAEEAAACQAWWDRIVGAATQSEWRATRKLYEAECRKPLAKVPVPATDAEPAAAAPAQ